MSAKQWYEELTAKHEKQQRKALRASKAEAKAALSGLANSTKPEMSSSSNKAIIPSSFISYRQKLESNRANISLLQEDYGLSYRAAQQALSAHDWDVSSIEALFEGGVNYEMFVEKRRKEESIKLDKMGQLLAKRDEEARKGAN